MKIPTSFTDKIKSTFYDKTINRHSVSSTKTDEGWTRDGSLTSNGSYKGNISFSKLDEVKEKYGLHEDVAAVVTTDADILNGDINSYNDIFYRVIKALPRDSHNMLILEEWSSKL